MECGEETSEDTQTTGSVNSYLSNHKRKQESGGVRGMNRSEEEEGTY
jgi:hypothetical protein